MFVAVDKNKNKVSIENADIYCQYFCPCCGAPLKIKAANSEFVRTHFAHIKGSDCDSFEHDMSEWHLEWQAKFPIENREVMLTNEAGEIHRADVCINQTVIEFQHSPIKASEIARRNEFYTSCGYKMVWVFDANDQIKNEYGESIDPYRCRSTDLCWKRIRNQQFAYEIPHSVAVYLHYKTEVSIPQLKGQKVDVLILLTRPKPKYFEFFDAHAYNNQFCYIFPINFLKEYGVLNDDNIPSISQIIQWVKQYHEAVKRQREELERRRAIAILNSMHKKRGGRL